MHDSTEAMIKGMEMLDSDDRVKLLEDIGRLHGVSLTLFTLLEATDHADHKCELSFPKAIIDGYMEAFHKDVYSSVEMTCIANGIDYAPDPNKEVRDEILNSSTS